MRQWSRDTDKPPPANSCKNRKTTIQPSSQTLTHKNKSSPSVSYKSPLTSQKKKAMPPSHQGHHKGLGLCTRRGISDQPSVRDQHHTIPEVGSKGPQPRKWFKHSQQLLCIYLSSLKNAKTPAISPPPTSYKWRQNCFTKIKCLSCRTSSGSRDRQLSNPST